MLRLVRFDALAVVAALIPMPALAQDAARSLGELQGALNAGQTIVVTDDTGHGTRAEVVDVPAPLVLRPRGKTVARRFGSGVGVAAQQLGEEPVRASLEREATRLASTLVARDPFWNRSTGVNTPLAQRDRSDDWASVLRLKEGTHVFVATRQGRGINGRLTAVSPDTLQMVVRRGRTETLSRDDVGEVRLGHRLGVAQHAGLGLLLGGVTGFLVGSAAACDSNVCGGEGGLAVAGGFVHGTFLGGIGGFVVGEAVHARPGRLVYGGANPRDGGSTRP